MVCTASLLCFVCLAPSLWGLGWVGQTWPPACVDLLPPAPQSLHLLLIHFIVSAQPAPVCLLSHIPVFPDRLRSSPCTCINLPVKAKQDHSPWKPRSASTTCRPPPRDSSPSNTSKPAHRRGSSTFWSFPHSSSHPVCALLYLSEYLPGVLHQR